MKKLILFVGALALLQACKPPFYPASNRGFPRTAPVASPSPGASPSPVPLQSPAVQDNKLIVLISGLAGPRALALDARGSLYVADTGNNQIRRRAPAGAMENLGTSAGTPSFPLDRPYGIAVTSEGKVFVANTDRNCIEEIGADGSLRLTAGSEYPDFKDGAANLARFRRPMGLALDQDGNLFVADTDNNRIRRIDAVTREVSTIAGDGQPGMKDGNLVEARFNRPSGLAFDSRGNLFVADSMNDCVRKLDLVMGEVTTPIDGRSQDRFPLNRPAGIAFDRKGDLFIADTFNSRILRFEMASGVLSSQIFEYSGGDPPLGRPFGLTIDSEGRLYIADPDQNCIRAVDVGF